jgi:hypothetical protein
VPEPSAFEVDMLLKAKKTKKTGIDQILAEFIFFFNDTATTEIYTIIYSIWNKEELPKEWKECIVVPVYRKGDQIVVITQACQFIQLHTKFYSTSCCQGQLHMQRKLLGIINIDFNATDRLMIIYTAFVKYWEKNGKQ